MRNTPDLSQPPHRSEQRSDWLRWLAPLAASAFLLSPLFFHAWRNAGTAAWDLLFGFNVATSVLWLLLVHSLARRPLRLHVLLLPLYLTTAIDLFLIGTFDARLSTGYVTIALTDYADTGELISTYARPLAISALALLLVYLPCLYAMRGLQKRRSPRWAALCGALLVGVYGAAIAHNLRQGSDGKDSVLDVVGKDLGAPFGVLFQGGLALQMQAESREFRRQREAFSYGATQATADGGEIYVWVIGESSRPQNWSLFGYTRDTNPRLRATPGVVGLPDMLTTAPHTSVAVPSMLSLRPITDWTGILTQKSIVQAFNEVGFKTYWLSAQAADTWAGLIPQMAAEAQRRRYFDSGHDGAMLADVRAILSAAAANDKLFIVLHSKGSHFDYARRYPAQFARFNTGAGTRRAQLVDAYDNSVLYTDWFLAELISMLAERATPSALIYASDHGENLLDDQRQLLGHALGTRYDLPTAAFVWLSDALARRRPQQLQALKANAGARLSLSNLPHSMLDLAHIDTQEFDPRQSIFSDRFAPSPRHYIVRGRLHVEYGETPAPKP